MYSFTCLRSALSAFFKSAEHMHIATIVPTKDTVRSRILFNCRQQVALAVLVYGSRTLGSLFGRWSRRSGGSWREDTRIRISGGFSIDSVAFGTRRIWGSCKFQRVDLYIFYGWEC
jgi:hypothetical protein